MVETLSEVKNPRKPIRLVPENSDGGRKRTTFQLLCGPYRLALSGRTLIMGILNVTPDSFSDGNLFFEKGAAIAHGEALVAAGADIIDIGGESTRPLAEPVPVDEEIRRVIPVIEGLAPRVSVPISIDTTKSQVAAKAIEAGASIVNDIAGLRGDSDMAAVVADAGVCVVLMHMKGTPRTMQIDPEYKDVVTEVRDFLAEAIDSAGKSGIDRNKIVVDPGIGFGKTVNHNLLLIRDLRRLGDLGCPVLVGPSRKSFITKLLGAGKRQREMGTQAAVAVAALNGAHIVRVHDVVQTRQTLALVDAIKNSAE